MNANSIPSSAVVRVSRGNFDPGRFPAVDRVSHDIGGFLVPAIKRLDGLIGYYAGASPEGSMVHVSVWQSDEHANQMGRLKEMVVDARAASEAVGVTFTPIVNYPVAWVV